ncbi:MAG: hypothetical protein M0R40_01845 [Firmicutes bacterium]|nr:hypothetical protein [Bacillota bacterium]
MIKQLLNRKRFIIAFTVLFVCVSAGVNFLAKYNRQTMILTLSYEGTNRGLNPDGTRFVISEIKSESILDDALKHANLNNYTVSDIKDRIDIYPIISSASLQNVRIKVAEGADYAHIPNEFRISYSQKNKFEKNHTVNLLEALAKAYKDNFINKYVASNDCLLPESYNNSDYEFVEIADLYAGKINSMIAYLQKNNSEAGAFRAQSNSRTFGDVIMPLQNLRNVDVEKYKSFIIKSGLAKDKDAYTNKLRYTVDIQSYDYEKAYNSAKFTENAITKYDPNITGIMFIPSLDNIDGFYMNRTKTGIDYLATDAYKRGTTAGSIKASLDYKKYLIGEFESKDNSVEEHQRLSEIAHEMLSTIDSKMYEISGLAIETDEEYLQTKTGNYIQFQLPSNRFIGYFSIRKIISSGMTGLILSFLYVIAIAYIRSEVQPSTRRRRAISKSKTSMEVAGK